MYDDRPLWEQDKSANEQTYNKKDDYQRETPPRYSDWRGHTSRTAASPSSLYSWYHEQNALRQQGKLNEIDLNEIRAALKGTHNKWACVVKKETKAFDFFVSKPTDAEWVRLLDMRNNDIANRPL